MLTNDREQMARQPALVREEYQKASKDLMDVEQNWGPSPSCNVWMSLALRDKN